MKNYRLKEARRQAKLSQTQLSEYLGYKGRQSVANWENGYSSPTLKVAILIARVLEEDVYYLFGQQVQESHTNDLGFIQSTIRKELI